MEKNVIKCDGRFYIYENNCLYDAQTKVKIAAKNYLFINNYGLVPYNALIIGKNLIWIVGDKFIETSVSIFVNNKSVIYYKTLADSVCSENYVFSRHADEKIQLLGRSFKEITEGLYKIGNNCYQLAGENLVHFSKCKFAEFMFERLDIFPDGKEEGFYISYKKKLGVWKVINKGVTRSETI